jgi:predicted helicase
MYRPFARQHLFLHRALVDTPGRTPEAFRDVGSEISDDLMICALAPIDRTPFAVLMVRYIPGLNLFMDAQNSFPRWVYEEQKVDNGFDFESGDELADGRRRVDNISDARLDQYQTVYGTSVSKDDIFYYSYGLLHSTAYRVAYAADLKKGLPRIPMVQDFDGFSAAGRLLADLHVNYESVAPYPLDELVNGKGKEDELYRVQKMTFARGSSPREKDRTRIVYNSRITLSGIPEAAYEYKLGSRSAIEWIMDRYQVKTDRASGIVNDPNDWATEHGDPRYILDLLKRIVTVSVETMKVIDSLPGLDIVDAPKEKRSGR